MGVPSEKGQPTQWRTSRVGGALVFYPALCLLSHSTLPLMSQIQLSPILSPYLHCHRLLSFSSCLFPRSPTGNLISLPNFSTLLAWHRSQVVPRLPHGTSKRNPCHMLRLVPAQMQLLGVMRWDKNSQVFMKWELSRSATYPLARNHCHSSGFTR